jgi:hypothetical protein
VRRESTPGTYVGAGFSRPLIRLKADSPVSGRHGTGVPPASGTSGPPGAVAAAT